eukprot:544895-Pelagomonas_calceolata.AAC.4
MFGPLLPEMHVSLLESGEGLTRWGKKGLYEDAKQYQCWIGLGRELLRQASRQAAVNLNRWWLLLCMSFCKAGSQNCEETSLLSAAILILKVPPLWLLLQKVRYQCGQLPSHTNKSSFLVARLPLIKSCSPARSPTQVPHPAAGDPCTCCIWGGQSRDAR